MKRISIWILLISPMISIAQKRFSLELLAGANQSFIRNKVLIGEAPAYGFHIGLNARYKVTAKDNVSIGISLLHSLKGYKQKAIVDYNPTFFYNTCQTLAFVRVHRAASLYSGLEFALLNDVNVNQGLSTYQRTDIGWVTGMRIFDTSQISMNMQMVYGFKPVLRYHEFDKYGNITGTIDDLKNLCISIGMAYKIFNR